LAVAVLFVAGVLASGAFWYFLGVHRRHAALWTGFAAAVLFLLGVALYLRNEIIRSEIAEGAAKTPSTPPTTEPFRARLVTVMSFAYPSLLVYLYDSALGKRLAPVGLAVVINVENARSSATRIISYALDVNVDGSWVRLHALDTLNPSNFFWVKDGNLKTCVRFDFSEDAFSPRFRDRNFGPGEIAGGWMFFEWPPELRMRAATPIMKNVRLQLASFTGERQTIVLENAAPSELGAGGLEGGKMRTLPGISDLSGTEVLPFMDLPPSMRERKAPAPSPTSTPIREAERRDPNTIVLSSRQEVVERAAEDALRRGCVKLKALRKSIGQFIDALEVSEYHSALDDVTRAGRDVEDFRIPPTAFKRQVISISMRSGHGAQYSKDPLVARDYFDRRIDAVIDYLGCDEPGPASPARRDS
jgi:hypothetical protein